MKTIAVAALLAGGLLGTLMAFRHGARDAGADASSVKIERVAAALDEVRRDLRVLRAAHESLADRVDDLPRTTAREPSAQAEAAHAQEGAPEHRAAAAPPSEDDRRAQSRHYIEYADRTLAAQPRDTAWNAARELPARVQAILPRGSRIESVTCGSTLCRVETLHATMDEYRAFMSNGFDFAPKPDTEFKPFWHGPSAFLVDDDSNPDGVHAIAYLAREDSTLPSPPE